MSNDTTQGDAKNPVYVALPVFVPQGATPAQAIMSVLSQTTNASSDMAVKTLIDVILQLIAGGKADIDIANVKVPIGKLVSDIIAFKSIDWEGMLAAIEGKQKTDWAGDAEVFFVDALSILSLFIPEAIIGVYALEVGYPLIKWWIDNRKPTPPDPPYVPPPPPPGPIDPNPVIPDYHPGPFDGRFSTKGKQS